MSVYSDDPPTSDISDYYENVYGLIFMINPAERRQTGISLSDSQDQLMHTFFPKDDNYLIHLELHPPEDKEQWEFIKTTLITFENMIQRKLRTDGRSYQEAPAIELVFVVASRDPVEVYTSRLTDIKYMLLDHHERGGGLKYWISDKARPTEWAMQCVKWGIVNKDDY